MKRIYGLFSAMLMMLLLGVNISSAVEVTIGTGTTTTQYYPYYYNYGGTKTQMIFTAAELTAAGATAGSITSLAFYHTVVGAVDLQQFSVRIKNTTLTNFPNTSFSPYATGEFTQVYSGIFNPSAAGSANNWVPINFTTPFAWDGTSNIMVEVLWINPTNSGNGTNTVRTTATTGNNMTLYKYQDNVGTPAGFTATGSTTANRPNVKLQVVNQPFFAFNPPQASVGYLDPNATSLAKTAKINAILLNPAAGTITLTPTSNVSISLDSATWVTGPSTLTLPYTGATITNQNLHYKLTATPNEIPGPLYTGSVTITGGGAAEPTVMNISANTNIADAYCSSSATSEYDQDIGNVTIKLGTETLLNNGEATPLYNRTDGNKMYTDFSSSIPPIDLRAGNAYTISVSVINKGTNAYSSIIKVYIDYNRNGIFDLPAELAWTSPQTGSGNTLTSDTWTGSFVVPNVNLNGAATAKMRVVLDEYDVAPPCGTYTYGETEDYLVHFLPGVPMVYQSTTTTQIGPAKTKVGSQDVKILNVDVAMAGSLNPMSLSKLTFSTNGSFNLAGITNAKLFKYGSDTVQVGTTITNPNGAMVFIPATPLTLVPGPNKFRLTYSVAADATLDTKLDAELTGVFISDAPAVNKITEAQSPNGFTLVNNVKFDGTFDNGTSLTDNGWTTAIITGGGTTMYWTNVSSGLYPSTAPHGGSRLAQFNANSAPNNAEHILVSPSFPMNGSGEPTTFSFWMYRGNAYPDQNGSTLSLHMNTANNLSGATLLHPVGSPTVDEINTKYNTGSLIESEAGWYKYTFEVPATFNTATNYLIFKAHGDWYNNIHIDDVFMGVDSYMAFDKIDTLNTGKSNFTLGSTNNIVNRVNLKTAGSVSPLKLTNVMITPEGTTNVADIQNLKVWYLGSSLSFDPETAVLFGTIANPVAGQNTIVRTASAADLNLAEGNNYFAVTVDVKQTAVVGRFVDVKFDGATISRGTNNYPQLITYGNTWGTHQIKAPLSGVYTVGGPELPTNYYPTLTGALDDLQELGTSANVELALAADQTLPSNLYTIIANPKSFNTNHKITIYPKTVARTITGSYSGEVAMLVLQNIKNLTIDGRVDKTGNEIGLTIKNTSVAVNSRHLLFFGNESDNNALKNIDVKYVHFEGATPTVSGISMFIYGEGNDSINISNNKVTGMGTALYSSGSTTDKYAAYNVKVNNNIFGDADTNKRFTSSPIELRQIKGLEIDKNIIMNAKKNGSTDGISLQSMITNANITNNIISHIHAIATYRATGIYVSATTDTNIVIANNRISNILSNGTGSASYATAGIHANAGVGIKVYHNTVNLEGNRSTIPGGTAEPNSPSMALYIGSGASNVDIKNNILINKLTSNVATLNAHSIYSDAPIANIAGSNGNVFFVPEGTTYFIGYLTTDRKTLADWKTITNKDANSASLPVEFTADMHLSAASALNTGIAVEPIVDPSVAKDIDGLARNVAPANTQAGADEAIPNLQITQNLPATVAGLCAPTTTTLEVKAGVTSFTDGIVRPFTTDPTLNYQWKKNGALIDNIAYGTNEDGTANNTVVNSNKHVVKLDTKTPDVGYNYSVLVSSLGQTVESALCNMVAEEVIKITEQPFATAELCTENGRTTLEVKATGTITGYQWQKLINNTWTNLAGETKSKVDIILADPKFGPGSYRALIFDGANHCSGGHATSNLSVLTAVEPLRNVVLESPLLRDGKIDVCEGGLIEVKLNRTVLTGNVFGSRWEEFINNTWVTADLEKRNFLNADGTLSIAKSNPANSGTYRYVLVGSSLCDTKELASNAVKINIKPYVTITKQPQPMTVCEKQSVMLTVENQGENALYQWYKDGVAITDLENPTYNKPVFIIDSATFSDAAVYNVLILIDGCVVGGESGSLISDGAAVQVMNETAIIGQPKTQTSILGKKAVFEARTNAIGASPDYIADFQWFNGKKALKDDDKFAGAKSSILVISSVEESDATANYYLRVKGLCGDYVYSDTVKVTISTFAFTTQPADVTTCDGSEVKLNAVAETTYPGETISYDWYLVANGNDELVKSGKSGELALIASPMTAGQYYVNAKLDKNGTIVKSNVIEVKVNDKPVITKALEALSVKIDSVYTLTAVASGNDLTYKWYRDGVVIENATAATYTTKEAAAGTFTYKVEVINTCGVASSEANVTVAAPVKSDVEDTRLTFTVSNIVPNPVVSNFASFTVQTEQTSPMRVLLVDAAGRTTVLFDGIINSVQAIEINTSDFANGAYYVMINLNGKSITRQFIVKR